MNGSTILKVAFYVVAAIIAMKIISEVVSFIASAWVLLLIGFLVWHFGFKKKNTTN